ncbi:MAG: adenosylmethionine decarboxylase [Brachymonas denitrificans]|jgi:S-adenosylmethionine decarboxylase|uniref:adenosylmethionine decarboxylase n=1 Tax=Brachymonas denitrificans TaxID=28220 RepID=UPI00202263A6|nr:adenosylmethionine decarboxylase [Brachymonas denitrificans]
MHTSSQTLLGQPARTAAAHVARKAPGLHLIGDLYGCHCDERLMLDAATIENFCLQAVEQAGLTSVGSLFHSFGEGGGVTGMVVLAESHLSLHTWPEDDYVTLDVYVCSYSQDNSGKAEALFKQLMDAFQPTEPHLHRVVRA